MLVLVVVLVIEQVSALFDTSSRFEDEDEHDWGCVIFLDDLRLARLPHPGRVLQYEVHD